MVRGSGDDPELEPTCCGAPMPTKDLFITTDNGPYGRVWGRRPREVYTTTSNGEKMLVRLNIQLKGGQGCFKPEPMLYHAGDSDTVPPALQELGMTWEEYHEIFVRQLSDIGERHFAEGCCHGFVRVVPKFLCISVTCLATLGCTLNWFVRRGVEQQKRLALPFDADLREWQTNANATLRQKYPIHIKTQSSSWTRYITVIDGDGKRVYARWIAVALNKEDAAQLLSEPHLEGRVNGGEQPPCRWGVPYNMDESIFCVHPYEQVMSKFDL